jgi:hypothetical protein
VELRVVETPSRANIVGVIVGAVAVLVLIQLLLIVWGLAV